MTSDVHGKDYNLNRLTNVRSADMPQGHWLVVHVMWHKVIGWLILCWCR